MDIQLWQWIYGAAAALLVGISKTGMPGAGILVVTILAMAFGGWQATGIMTPMLIFGDVFAVLWYRQHAQWDKLVKLFPWVAAGMIAGMISLWLVGESKSTKDILGIVIGVMVLGMLALHILKGRFGDKLTPQSKLGVLGTGAVAGFTTMVSNAAGPVMSIYLAGLKMPKRQFIGTLAWFFFIMNLSKVPVYAVLSRLHPAKPMLTVHGLLIDLMLLPAILVGVFIGKWMLLRISQRTFETVVLLLAGAAAIKLIIS
ncbi:MAG: sulfite exporter TauE/SafE family protein [Armatimonadota bacterium]|nr:sulfite exporter TauE/SafE family protein [bacterium]